jgi:hypothetical protein
MKKLMALISTEGKTSEQIVKDAAAAHERYQRAKGLRFDSNRWFTPRFAINYLWGLIRIHGDKVLKDSKFKKEREAWILGVALLGISKATQFQWWLQVPESDPPDMYTMAIVPNLEKNWNEFHHREIEIMEITKHTNGSIEDEITKKLKDKFYIKETGLVVYLNRSMQIGDMYEINKNLKKNKLNISDIWGIASISPKSQKYILFNIYPEVYATSFDIDEEIAKIPEGDTIDISRAKGLAMKLVRNVPATKFIP